MNESKSMEQRIDVLERDVCAIKSEIVQIKSTYWTREDGRALSNRLSTVEIELAKLGERVEGLARDVMKLQRDVAELRSEIADIRAEIANIRTEIANLRTEVRTEIAELRTEVRTEIANLRTELHIAVAHLKAWMIGIAISTITVTGGMQFALLRMMTP